MLTFTVGVITGHRCILLSSFSSLRDLLHCKDQNPNLAQPYLSLFNPWTPSTQPQIPIPSLPMIHQSITTWHNINQKLDKMVMTPTTKNHQRTTTRSRRRPPTSTIIVAGGTRNQNQMTRAVATREPDRRRGILIGLMITLIFGDSGSWFHWQYWIQSWDSSFD